MSAFWFFRHRIFDEFRLPHWCGHRRHTSAGGEGCHGRGGWKRKLPLLSEWEAARRENHAIRRKYTEGQLLGYATAWEGIVFPLSWLFMCFVWQSFRASDEYHSEDTVRRSCSEGTCSTKFWPSHDLWTQVPKEMVLPGHLGLQVSQLDRLRLDAGENKFQLFQRMENNQSLSIPSIITIYQFIFIGVNIQELFRDVLCSWTPSQVNFADSSCSFRAHWPPSRGWQWWKRGNGCALAMAKGCSLGWSWKLSDVRSYMLLWRDWVVLDISWLM